VVLHIASGSKKVTMPSPLLLGETVSGKRCQVPFLGLPTVLAAVFFGHTDCFFQFLPCRG